MKLILIRHGEALPGRPDQERSLSPRGRAQIQLVAMFLGTSGFKLDEIVHSGLVRARQTAEILAGSISNTRQVATMAGLEPDDELETFAGLLDGRDDDLLAVGHLFNIQRQAGSLLLGDPGQGQLIFGTGTAVCLERDDTDAPWQLGWLIRPEQLGNVELLV